MSDTSELSRLRQELANAYHDIDRLRAAANAEAEEVASLTLQVERLTEGLREARRILKLTADWLDCEDYDSSDEREIVAKLDALLTPEGDVGL